MFPPRSKRTSTVTLSDTMKCSVLSRKKPHRKYLVSQVLILLYLAILLACVGVTYVHLGTSAFWAFFAFGFSLIVLAGGGKGYGISGAFKTKWIGVVPIVAWVIASLLCFICALVQIAVEPFSIMYLSNAVFSLLSLAPLLIIWRRKIVYEHPENVSLRRHAPTLCLLRGMICIMSTAIALLLSYNAVEEMRYLQSVPESAFAIVEETGLRLHYWCKGEFDGVSLALIEPGFMLPSYGLYWIQKYLSNYTRTCVYEVSGTGFSSYERNPNFANDAANMESVFDAEFEKLGVDKRRMIAIAVGHGRGHISAMRLHVNQHSRMYRVFNGTSVAKSPYGATVVISIDGVPCKQGPQEQVIKERFASNIITRFLFAPFLGMYSGGMRIFWNGYKDRVLSGFDYDLGEAHQSDLPLQSQIEFRETLLKSNFWKSGAERSRNWGAGYYTGPTLAQCEVYLNDNHNDTNLTAKVAPLFNRTFNHIKVPANKVCLQEETVCAGHTSLATTSTFAKIAVEDFIAPYLDAALSVPLFGDDEEDNDDGQ